MHKALIDPKFLSRFIPPTQPIPTYLGLVLLGVIQLLGFFYDSSSLLGK